MDQIEIDTRTQQLLTPEQAWHYKIIPKEKKDKLCLFISDTIGESLRDELDLVFGFGLELFPVPHDSILKALSRYYHTYNEGGNFNIEQLSEQDVDGFLGRIISEAHKSRSSDIHIEPMKDKCRVRIRIDGKLIEKYNLESEKYPALLNKIKVKSNLDIAEKRLPQDGRFDFKITKGSFDIRVSTLPSIYGEKVVMRLLSNDITEININSLGFNDYQLNQYLTGIKKNQGIVLISGPTGSGKTTTLYATLKILNKEDTNILTIEDPVEYTIEGINQVQLKESIGLSFTKALRTFLRQDPDIIMLGEIRDIDTAQMAIRAALTGHLVLSTVHTNSAWGTISRLIDMGVPAYTLADTLILSVAQRLIRKLCENCKIPDYEVNDKLATLSKSTNLKIKAYQAKGCKMCHFTGYKGRKALYEILPVDKELRQHIKKQVSDIDDYRKKMRISSIGELALESVINGETSIDEAIPLMMNNE